MNKSNYLFSFFFFGDLQFFFLKKKKASASNIMVITIMSKTQSSISDILKKPTGKDD